MNLQMMFVALGFCCVLVDQLFVLLEWRQYSHNKAMLHESSRTPAQTKTRLGARQLLEARLSGNVFRKAVLHFHFITSNTSRDDFEMPFYAKDWRSPGESWIKTEDGWEKLKVLETNRRRLNSEDNVFNRFVWFQIILSAWCICGCC